MTYAEEAHPSYVKIRTAIAESPTTFVLLPSLDLESCMAEIVDRQVQRPFRLVSSREEAKIRERFPIYMALPARKLTTLKAPHAVVSEIMTALKHSRHIAQTDRSS